MGNAERRAIPKRIHWAVESMSLQPGQRVLEIGFGNGAAITLVHKLVGPDGHVHAIDQSEVQVERARTRNSWATKHGIVRIELAPLATATLDPEGYDVAFASNVNLFWTDDAAEELAAVRRALRPGGSFYLFYDTPKPARTAEVGARTAAVLEAAGFELEAVPSPTPTQWGVRARVR